MSQFFKSVFASCLGVILAFIALGFILMGIGASMGGDKGKSLGDSGILRLDFEHPFPEETNNVNTGMFGSEAIMNVGLTEFCKLISAAKTDSKIKGILINSNSNGNGFASTQKIIEALTDFKTSGKFIYSYADFYSQSAYIVSSVADSVMMNPNGEIDLKGYSITYPFFKGLFDKIGVKFEIFYAGNFKSATEPFRRTDMSPENKEQSREFLADMLDITFKELENNRKLSKEDVSRAMVTLSGKKADTALASRLIDKSCYWDEVLSILRKKANLSDSKSMDFVELMDYSHSTTKEESGTFGKDKIALVYAEGDVAYSNNTKGNINDEKYLKIFDKIRNDKKVKAVVLRVNSGGGSALTSDIIWREIELIKAQGIPVIASFGDYAASGGYYIACGADTIVAMESTLTGSIGVFSMMPNVKKLMNEKLGISFDTVRTHLDAIQLSAVQEMSANEKLRLQKSTDDIYAQFLDRVAKGRKMEKSEVHKYAQGRIWSGRRAKEIGLVDVLGNLDDAIAIAATKAKLGTDYRVSEYPKIKESIFEQLIREFIANSEKEDESVKILTNEYKRLKAYKQWMDSEGIQARIPVRFEF